MDGTTDLIVGVHPDPDQQRSGQWTTSEWTPDHPLLAAPGTMTARRALMYAPVWQAVSLISGDIAKLPVDIRRRVETGSELDIDHRWWSAVNQMANAQMSAFEFWRRMMIQCLIWSNSYALITDDGLWPLLSDRTYPDTTEFLGDWGQISPAAERFYRTEINGESFNIPANRVLHFQGISITGLGDLPLIVEARESWNLGLQQLRFASKFFERGGRVGGILEIPSSVGKIAADTIEEGFRKGYETLDNAFMTVILRDSAKFHAAQPTMAETQLAESRDREVREVARWFNLPTHKLGDTAPQSYSSLEQENQSYLDSTLSPWLRMIQQECDFKLLSIRQRERKTHFFSHDTFRLVQPDMQTAVNIGQVGRNNALFETNEWRERFGWNRHPEGDGLYSPLNIGPVGSQEAPEQPETDEEDLRALAVANFRERLAFAVDRLRAMATRSKPADENEMQAEFRQILIPSHAILRQLLDRSILHDLEKQLIHGIWKARNHDPLTANHQIEQFCTQYLGEIDDSDTFLFSSNGDS